MAAFHASEVPTGTGTAAACSKRSADAAVFAKAVERGDVLLAVVCSGESCDRAHHMLADAGATDVREEDSAGPA